MKKYYWLVTLLLVFSSCSYYIGKPKLAKGFKGNAPIVGNVYDDAYAKHPDYDSTHPLIKQFAATALPPIDQLGRHDFIRNIIAKLILHQDVQQINEYIMQIKPWARPGTDWALHKHADYDFAMIPWCMLLYTFDGQPEMLYPKTAEHIAKVLLIHEKHRKAIRTPGSMGILRETENHILMGEISRYLKNQWLHEHGDSALIHDNAKNGMEHWMNGHMHEKMQGGYYEFNSNPYSGYSLAALFTLYSFAHSDSVRINCGKLLDQTILEYALGSLDQRRFPPFRRRLERAGIRNFDEDPMTAYIKTLLSIKYPARKMDYAKHRSNFGLTALVLKYRLNDRLGDLLNAKQFDYLSRMGHGYKGSPELYSGGPGYLISAGGVQRGKASQLVPFPTTLLLHDNAHLLDSCFYLPGKGKISKWNNTGVYERFACGPLPVHTPYEPIAKLEGWQIFHRDKVGYIVVYNADGVGLLFVANEAAIDSSIHSPMAMAEAMKARNTGVDLQKMVITPTNDTIAYDLHAPKGTWVIKSVNSQKMKRKYDLWGRLEVISKWLAPWR